MTKNDKHPILLVDDEPDMLFSLEGLLRRDFQVHTASSAAEALNVLAAHEIHVVMTDQRMPEVTGVEMLGKVKAQYPDAIRIVFTGYADIKAVIEGINRGGLFRYITKPWDPDELIEVLHVATAKYQEMAERKELLTDVREFLARNSPPAQSDEGAQQAELISRIDTFLTSR